VIFIERLIYSVEYQICNNKSVIKQLAKVKIFFGVVHILKKNVFLPPLIQVVKHPLP